KSRRKQIDFKGVALVNALLSMRLQYSKQGKMAYDNPPAPRRITKPQYEKMNLEALQCINFATLCNQGQAKRDCDRAYTACQQSTVISLPKEVSIDMYDVREVCQNQVPDHCRPYADVERFLNKPEVKKSFGVDPAFDYKRYNPKVDEAIRRSPGFYADSYQTLGPLMDNNALKVTGYYLVSRLSVNGSTTTFTLARLHPHAFILAWS
ncbi:hypothetical protein Pmar_PMAR009772, partial [Perkinsus marinus ATCC 50983]